MGGVRHVTQVSASPPESADPVGQADLVTSGTARDDSLAAGRLGVIKRTLLAFTAPPPPAAPATGQDAPPAASGAGTPAGPVGRSMSWLIRKLSWSRLANPRVAVAVTVLGLLLAMIVGATAPNSQTIEYVWLPLTNLTSLILHGGHQTIKNGPHDLIASITLYIAIVLACAGLAGMLWAHSQGWRPNPRRLFLASSVAVAIFACLTPVGSSDTASYAAYGRIAALGHDPYAANAVPWLRLHDFGYYHVVVYEWKSQASVYGPVATWVQSFAAHIGGHSVQTTIWVLMLLNALVFLGVGLLLLKTSDDPVRATLFWTANPVLILELVAGGHFDTFVAATAIAAIQLARKTQGLWSDVLIGVLIGVGCGIKVTAALVALGLAWTLLRRREYLRVGRIALAAMVTVAAEYSYYGLGGLKPLFAGSQWVSLPSVLWIPWRIAELAGVRQSALALPVSIVWITAMFLVAWLIYQRISADQPREVVAPFALTFAYILVSPWVYAWYTALPWVALTQVPRNRMTRWLTIVTVVLAIWHSNGGWVPSGQI
jgi:Glycosyltransferase family 87